MTPAFIKDTTMRSAFQDALDRPGKHPLKGTIKRGLKRKMGRIYHRKGFFVTRGNH